MAAQARYILDGLQERAEIHVDRWGIPHIRAASAKDAFFVQGFNAGRDRLWQVDMWRKRGLGLLAGDFGPGFLAQDRAARLFLYRGNMEQEWRAYGHCDARAMVEAFVAGLNTWINLTRHRPELLAPEFTRLNVQPALWEASDVVRIRTHARAGNLLSEFVRARVLGAGGDTKTDVLRQGILADHRPVDTGEIDWASLPGSILDVYRLAIAPLDLDPERLACSLEEAWKWSKVNDVGEVLNFSDGSNAWCLSGERTATGRPILANDPHRPHTLPSLRYLVHLKAPGLNVIGAGEPALPGVSIGHNETSAFGLTIFPMDQEDLYFYETSPDHPNCYKYAGQWEKMEVRRESIPVRNQPAQEIVIKHTRHGPVIFEDATASRAFAVRTVWSEPGASAYLASLGYLRASTAADFATARSNWVAPPVNHVYADTTGATGWFVSGKAPQRPNWDGLLPVPGDGRYEWEGFVPVDRLPSRRNSASGYFATANEHNIPVGDPAAKLGLGYELNERARFDRIVEVLEGNRLHTVTDSVRLQCDVTSLPARRLVGLLRLTDYAAVDKVRTLFDGWDCRLDIGSNAATLFEIWWNRHLKPALLEKLVRDPAIRDLIKPGDNEELLAILEGTSSRFVLPAAQRDDLMRQTLSHAVKACVRVAGEDNSKWSWGDLHRHTFMHAAHALAPNVARSIGPLSVGGSDSTPLYAKYRLDDFRVLAGASFRMVLDVGKWDDSRCVNAPGQSGDSRSAHYSDHSVIWQQGETVPLLFSNAAIDQATEFCIELMPSGIMTPKS